MSFLDDTNNIPRIFICDMIKNVFLLAEIGSANICLCWVRMLTKHNMIWGKLKQSTLTLKHEWFIHTNMEVGLRCKNSNDSWVWKASSQQYTSWIQHRFNWVCTFIALFNLYQNCLEKWLGPCIISQHIASPVCSGVDLYPLSVFAVIDYTCSDVVLTYLLMQKVNWSYSMNIYHEYQKQ